MHTFMKTTVLTRDATYESVNHVKEGLLNTLTIQIKGDMMIHDQKGQTILEALS